MKIEIMDTTLRDGEQTSGISFTAFEKLNIAKMLLEEVKVDRIEVASARVSEGEFEGVKRIAEWAQNHNLIDKVEVLGFVDGKISIDWMKRAGCKVLNLLTKGSLKHLKGQLKKTPEQHVEDIKFCVQYAKENGLNVNIYFEDWSNGMRHSREYLFFMMNALKDEPIDRFMIPDTLGILNPDETFQFCKIMTETWPGKHFDFHPHNDYDLATGNVYVAVKAGVKGIHTTVNGLGERAGNAPLSSTIAILKDLNKVQLSVNEGKINKVSKLVETISGLRIPSNKPIIGENVFTQTSGVHADGDKKENLYFNDLLPERFGRIRQYALGKLAGKANILKNLEEQGIELDEETMRKVTQRVIELGDKKEFVTASDLPYIISDILDSREIKDKIKIKNYSLNVANGLRPVAIVSMEIGGDAFEDTSAGDGQYDAFMNAVHKIYDKLGKPYPRLVDYVVTIPPGGKTDALVETVITWENGRQFKTRAVDPDQTVAAIKATMKMLNIIEKD
jgi:D-citramalate synthase